MFLNLSLQNRRRKRKQTAVTNITNKHFKQTFLFPLKLKWPKNKNIYDRTGVIVCVFLANRARGETRKRGEREARVACERRIAKKNHDFLAIMIMTIPSHATRACLALASPPEIRKKLRLFCRLFKLRSHFFIIIEKKINKSPAQIMFTVI